MKIDLKKLTASQHASIPFSETIDLREETLYGAKPFQSPVQMSGEVSGESGILRLKGTIKTIYSTACARCHRSARKDHPLPPHRGRPTKPYRPPLSAESEEA